MRRTVASLALIALLAAPAVAQEEQTPDELALEAFDKLKRAFDLFLGSIPMYATPEMLPNGDIIIRRIHPEEEEAPAVEDEETGTRDT
jgi:hypothetical protein